MKKFLQVFLIAILPILASCSMWPEPDHSGPETGAYARKLDQVHMAKARRFLARGESAKARQELDRLSEKAQSASMHLLVAESFFREGNSNTAQTEIGLAAELEPENPAVDMLRGMVAESIGDWSSAGRSYLKASSKDRDNIDPVLAYARAMHAMGDPVRAATYLEREIGARPVNFALSMAAGDAYLSLGSPHDGVTHFSHATELEPENFQAREGLVLALSLAGAHQEALARVG
ncbi:MAG: tetratricopeptide repeat protein, partial [Planctomycetota bacterium]